MSRIKLLLLSAMFALIALNSTAKAQDVRVFTPRNGALYEVIEGSRTGGAFINQYRGVVAGRPIYGYTDRVSRGERVEICYRGAFPGDWAYRIGYGYNWNQVRYSTYYSTLPKWVTVYASTNPYDDNMFVFMQYNWWNWAQKRVPIGSR